jgi:hypothetical protein
MIEILKKMMDHAKVNKQELLNIDHTSRRDFVRRWAKRN